MKSRAVWVSVLLLSAIAAYAEDDQASKRGPKITDRVFFDIEIDGKAAGPSQSPSMRSRSLAALPVATNRRGCCVVPLLYNCD
jgi:hypothetical protein